MFELRGGLWGSIASGLDMEGVRARGASAMGEELLTAEAVAIVLVVAMGSLGPLIKATPKNFLPNEDESRFEITIRAPEGTALAQTALFGERMARALKTQPEVTTTVLTVGAPADLCLLRPGALFEALHRVRDRGLGEPELLGLFAVDVGEELGDRCAIGAGDAAEALRSGSAGPRGRGPRCGGGRCTS